MGEAKQEKHHPNQRFQWRRGRRGGQTGSKGGPSSAVPHQVKCKGDCPGFVGGIVLVSGRAGGGTMPVASSPDRHSESARNQRAFGDREPARARRRHGRQTKLLATM